MSDNRDPQKRDPQHLIDEYWSTYAKDYDAHQAHRLSQDGEEAAWRNVWRSALPTEPSKVLDIGTGSGNVAYSIASLGHEVVGIDLAEGMLHTARNKAKSLNRGPKPSFLKGDAARPPFPEGTFDAVVGRYVMWTMVELETALASWFNVLKSGGKLVMVDGLWFPEGLVESPHAANESARTRDFRQAYQPVQDRLTLAESDTFAPFVKSVEEAGFSEVNSEPLLEILDLDKRHGVAPNHEPTLVHRITAVRP